MPDEVVQALRRTATAVGGRLDAVFDDVDELRRVVDDLAHRCAGSGNRPDRAELAAVRPAIRALLARAEPLVQGMGLAVDRGALEDTDHWLEWWRRTGSGDSAFVRHALDPGAVGYYDYQSREWFQAPLQAGAATAVGPYLDAGGTDSSTVTLAAPLQLASGGACVVAADLSASELEGLVLTSLGTREHVIAVVTSQGRIVGSTSARLVAGARLPADLRGAVTHEAPVRCTRLTRLPWRVVCLGPARAPAWGAHR